MPAEWEPQSATWLSWPSNTALWPGHYDLIPAKFAEFAAAISRFQPVKINAAGKLRAEAETKKQMQEEASPTGAPDIKRARKTKKTSMSEPSSASASSAPSGAPPAPTPPKAAAQR